MSEEQLYFNGINGATGGYLMSPMTPAQLSAIVLGEELDEQHVEELKGWHEYTTMAHWGPKEGVDPKDLAQSGWGVIFALDDKDRVPALKDALGELLALRREQAGEYYREFTGEDAYRPGESKSEFLARHGMGPGPADPEKVPYYLMIVGDPARIPYTFQYQLDVQYAVGRVHLASLDEYARYARSVVQAERGELARPRSATFFGVANDEDRATQLSAQQLVLPLAEAMSQDQPDWDVRTLVGDGQATKAALGRLLGGDETPALLFTASHGLGFPLGDTRQLPHQGALLCQDWPGPGGSAGAIRPDHYFSAEDLGAGARLRGLLAFHFACFGAGTPEKEYFGRRGKAPAAIAPHAFVSRLPQQMLGHPGGGALAVVGHVDRAWGYSFVWKQAGAQLVVFESTMKRLMEGHPVGSALEYFNQRYAELSSELSSELGNIEAGKKVNELALTGMWTANNDARSYVVLGDPAVRLPVSDDGTVLEPAIEPVTIASDRIQEDPMSSNEPAPQAREPEKEEELAGEVDFLPMPTVDPRVQELDPELYGYWREHVRTGFEHNDELFRRILEGFMRPYRTTIWMYRILFAVGVGLFVASAVLYAVTENLVAAGLFSGLGVVAMLRFFIGLPLQALEQNLKFITWLGITYNTYWTRLVWAMNEDTVQQDIKDATDDAIAEINRLIDKHATLSERRPSAEKQEKD